MLRSLLVSVVLFVVLVSLAVAAGVINYGNVEVPFARQILIYIIVTFGALVFGALAGTSLFLGGELRVANKENQAFRIMVNSLPHEVLQNKAHFDLAHHADNCRSAQIVLDTLRKKGLSGFLPFFLGLPAEGFNEVLEILQLGLDDRVSQFNNVYELYGVLVPILGLKIKEGGWEAYAPPIEQDEK